jgi:hypothetical protein
MPIGECSYDYEVLKLVTLLESGNDRVQLMETVK